MGIKREPMDKPRVKGVAEQGGHETAKLVIKDAGKKVFLILDNLRVHHGKPIKARGAERQDNIELFACPATARD